jgi:hypothetical protein
MSDSADLRARIAGSVHKSVHLRGRDCDWSEQARGFKEWWHFTVHAPELDLVVNFSLSDELGPTARPGSVIPRVGCLVHRGRWHGDIDSIPRGKVRARRGERLLELAHNRVQFEDGAFQIDVTLQDQPIKLSLRLVPLSLPLQINDFQIQGSAPMNWLVVPRLLATGWVRIGEERFSIEQAPAYHDHNWGGFRWGANFTWEWGYALPTEPSNPWSLVFVRLSDRARVQDFMQGLFVWRSGRQERAFSAGEIAVSHRGLLRQKRVLKLPRVMGLVAPGTVSDVPERFEVEARRDADWLRVRFDAEDLAQIVVPNDDDLGLTVINEVTGTVRVEGVIERERIEFQVRSLFEFLHA